jgi:hypothetical protein
MSTAAPPAPTTTRAPASDAGDDAGADGADGAQQPQAQETQVIEGTMGEVLTLPSLCMECFKNVRGRGLCGLTTKLRRCAGG